ncbi:beta-L-arabinofuranosidase domain-containing protein [Pedobacter lithocola]|uniref:Beta-L-arabinofuranosidase domain-containing protein n=1 Tax=Pedobacter lithocola TaxID=1908239 RepID=A0ABV8PCY8_9SPHI
MRFQILLLSAFLLSTITVAAQTNAPATNPYQELPLGTIKPHGWLREMLVRQKTGSTGNLEQLYPAVMGKRNGWLGGDGDQWERGPYWLDGLLPLAYILNDKELIAKVKPWIEWSIASQRADGYFGPSKDYEPENGLQRDNAQDWWPKMVMLKVLKQYYSATGDKRIIKLMTNYFRYQLKELPNKPLDNWTFWARYRGGDNLMLVYWLHGITKDGFLLELGDLIHKQTFDYTKAFANSPMLSTKASLHCVNLAQGFKEPIIYYQHHREQKYLDATQKGLDDLIKFNGMAHGLYGGDEALHGNNPTQGSELCSAVEMMFSLESMLEITGNIRFADQLEKITFNALPAQASDDFVTHQYFQQANQVLATRKTRNFEVNHHGTDLCYGVLTGFPCCTSNMHQGWPKFVQNLFYATADKGIAALVYSPAEVSLNVSGNVPVTVVEETEYPFNETVRFKMQIGSKSGVEFPFHLRIPTWCKKATIKINGEAFSEEVGNKVVKVARRWKNGDVLELVLPMHIYKNNWYENSVSIERGPLVYGLKIGEDKQLVKNEKDPQEYGPDYYEIKPTTPWNYGLTNVRNDKLAENFKVEKSNGQLAEYPWNQENAPIKITTKARRIPSWQVYNEMAGPVPFSTIFQFETEKNMEEITLIPYGCTQLRISQFPVIR